MNALRSMGTILRLFFAERRLALLGGIALAALTLIAGTALLGLSGWFITATALAGISAVGAVAFDVFAPSAGIRLFAITRTVARYGERLVTHDAALAVLAGLRERLFLGWAAPEAAGRLADRPARLLFRLTLDIDALDSLYLRVLVPGLAAIAVTLAAAVFIGFIDPRTALAFAAVVLGCGFLIPLLGLRAARRPGRRRAHALEVLRARAIDLVAGQTELVMTGRLAAEREAFAAADRRQGAADDALNRVEVFTGAGLSAAGGLLLALALLVAAGLKGQGVVDAPLAALLLLVALAAFDPFGMLKRGVVECERALIAARRVAPRLSAPVVAGALPAPGPGEALRLEGVAVGHAGSTRPVLTGLDLVVRAGGRLAIVGASGAGKSTLLAAIAGEIGIGAGRLAAVPSTLLTQRTELFRDTLRGNLLIADPDAGDARLLAALEAAGLGEVVAALPEGLGTLLGEGGLGLSGGQARRLALARLFLRAAPLWLLDEPTEGLDGATARDVVARVAAVSHANATVFATHLRREAEVADRIALIADGRIQVIASKGEPAFDAALATLRPD